VFILSMHSAKKKCKEINPVVLVSNEKVFFYLLIRIIFLLMYEFFFRGVLFFSLLEALTLFWAIFICTSLYILIHIFDSRQEIIGAIPFGIVLCLLTFYTQSIWVPFIIHCTLSGVYEISIYRCLTKQFKGNN
jgi:membrane protease YdiL (CAAX protease family)